MAAHGSDDGKVRGHRVEKSTGLAVPSRVEQQRSRQPKSGRNKSETEYVRKPNPKTEAENKTPEAENRTREPSLITEPDN